MNAWQVLQVCFEDASGPDAGEEGARTSDRVLVDPGMGTPRRAAMAPADPTSGGEHACLVGRRKQGRGVGLRDEPRSERARDNLVQVVAKTSASLLRKGPEDGYISGDDDERSAVRAWVGLLGGGQRPPRSRAVDLCTTARRFVADATPNFLMHGQRAGADTATTFRKEGHGREATPAGAGPAIIGA